MLKILEDNKSHQELVYHVHREIVELTLPILPTKTGQRLEIISRGQGVSSRASLISLITINEWHCQYLVTKPRQWLLSDKKYIENIHTKGKQVKKDIKYIKLNLFLKIVRVTR